MENNKTIVFDMDGTLCDLYSVKGWLKDLRSGNARPYKKAEPLYNMDSLKAIIEMLKACGWQIVVTSWLAKGSTKEYNKQIRQAKKAWLEKYNFPYDEIHLVKYGTTKADCTRKKGGYQVLVDDDVKIRNGWTLGKTIDANQDITSDLLQLVDGI